MQPADRAGEAVPGFDGRRRALPVAVMAMACLLAPGSSWAQQAAPDAAADEPTQIRVPKPRPRMMTVENPQTTEAEVLAFSRSKDMLDYRKDTREGIVNDRTRDLITRVIRIRIDQMTLPSERQNLAKLRSDFLNQDVRMASGKEGVPYDARELLLKVATERCEQLLTAPEGSPIEQNFYVRLNLAILLSHLNYTDDSKNQEARAYAPAADTMLKVLSDPLQPDLLKVAIANGLRRIALTGAVSRDYKKQLKDLQTEIATAAIAELKRPGTEWWYQMRLVEVLGATDVGKDLAGRPIVVDELVRTMADKKRHWQVRAECAKALGRTPLSNVQNQLLTWEIVEFTREMAEALAKDPKRPYWNGCFFNAYLAFRPLDKVEEAWFVKNGLNRRDTNLLRLSAPPNTADALEAIKPIVKHVLTNPGVPVPAGQLQAAQSYLADKRPRDFRIHPELQPVRDLNAVSTSPVAEANPTSG